MNTPLDFIAKKIDKGYYQQAIEAALPLYQVALEEQQGEMFVQICHYLAESYGELANYQQAQQYITLALSKNTSPKLTAQTYYLLGNLNSLLGNYKKQLIAYQKSLKILEQLPNHTKDKAELTAKFYNSIADCYGALGQRDKQFSYLQKNLIAYKNQVFTNQTIIAYTYHELGAYYTEQSDYDKALLFLKKSLTIWQNIHSNAHPEIAWVYNHLGWCYISKGDIDKGIKYNEKALQVRQQFYPPIHPQIAQSYSNIGFCYSRQNNKLPQILSCYKKALSIQLQLFDNQKHPSIFVSYRNLGYAYVQLKQEKKALPYFAKALQVGILIYGQYHPEVVTIYLHTGNCYVGQKAYEKAVEQYHLALTYLIPDFSTKAITTNPKLPNFYTSQRLLLYALEKKAHYLQSIDKHLIAFDTYAVTDHLVDEIRKSYKAEGSKLLLAQKASVIYEKAIQTALQLYEETNNNKYLSQAFTFSEKSKGILLLSSLKEEEAKIAANIPSDLLAKEKELSFALTDLDKKISEAYSYNIDREKLVVWKDTYFAYQQQYEQLVEQLEKDFPAYHQLKYNIRVAELNTLQKALKNLSNTQQQVSMIEYFVGQETIYIFLVTTAKVIIKKVPKPDKLLNLIQDFQQAINWADEIEFITIGQRLYQLLWQPIEQIIKTNEQLIIIRDDVLNFLPFECLLPIDNEEIEQNFSTLNYLVTKHEISYHYSATLLLHGLERQEKTNKQPNSFLGVAPVQFKEHEEPVGVVMTNKASTNNQTKVLRTTRFGSVDNLPNSALEVKRVFELFQAKQLNAKALLYNAASKEKFKAHVKNQKYILIATHGFTQEKQQNDLKTGIYLAQDIDHPNDEVILYTAETYHLELSADLVVLSSCESGIGELQKGEGMVAINRGFLYAGAANIIFSLFEIPDESTKVLIEQLFQYILAGDPYATALQKVKMNMIADPMFTPQDWGGFVLIGL